MDPSVRTTRSVDECRELDRRAIEEYGIPGLLLMEHASIGAAAVAIDLLRERNAASTAPVAVICGPGNNGGDGFAVARHLANAGYDSVTCYDLAPDAGPDESDSGIQRRMVDAMDVPRISCETSFGPPTEPALWIDAIFGTGLGRPAAGRFEQAIEAMNANGAPILAIDVPSGLDANRGAPIGPTVRADVTVTFGVSKIGYADAAAWTGELHVVSIGLPPQIRPHGAPGFPPLSPPAS